MDFTAAYGPFLYYGQVNACFILWKLLMLIKCESMYRNLSENVASV